MYYTGFLPASTDYATTNQSITFRPSDTVLNVTVQITDDNVYELQETFSAMLSTTDLGVVIIANTANATISDDDSKFTMAAVTSLQEMCTVRIIESRQLQARSLLSCNVHFSTLAIMYKLIGSFLYGFSPARTHHRI